MFLARLVIVSLCSLLGLTEAQARFFNRLQPNHNSHQINHTTYQLENSEAYTTVFGPEKFYRGFRRPRFQKIDFTVNDLHQEFELVITNGINKDLQNCRRARYFYYYSCQLRNWWILASKAKKMSLKINDELVLNKKKLSRRHPQTLKIPISSLQENNTIEVKVLGPSRWSFVTVKINGKALPNELPIAEFSYEVKSETESLTVLFDASASSDPDGEIISYDWEFGDGNTEQTNLPTTEYTYAQGGSYTALLKVTDNRSGESLVFDLSLEVVDPDTIPPQIFNLSINENQTFYLRDLVLDISGQSDEALQSLTINGQAPQINILGLNFSSTINLETPGAQTIDIEAIDLVGNTTNLSIPITVIIDQKKPLITGNFVSDITTNNSSYNLDYQIVDDNPLVSRVYLNNSLALESSETEVSQVINLNPGLNQIKIVAQDKAGNQAEPVIIDKLILDTAPAVISFISPGQGEFLETSSFTILGTSSEELSQIQIEGQNLTLSQDNLSFSGNLNYQGEAGLVTLTGTAQDLAGNTTSLNLEVFIEQKTNQEFAYILNKSEAKLIQLNTETLQIENEINLSSAPTGEIELGSPTHLVLSKDFLSVFTVQSGRDNIKKIDLELNEIVFNQVMEQELDNADNIITYKKPVEANAFNNETYYLKAFVPELISDDGQDQFPEISAKLAIIDNQQNTLSSEVSLPQAGKNLALSENGSELYISTATGDILSFDTGLKTLNSPIQVPVSGFESNYLLHTNNKLYVTSFNSSNLYIIDSITRALSQTISTGLTGVASELHLSPDKTKLYILTINGSLSSHISEFDISSGVITQTYSYNFPASSMSLNLEGDQFWLTDQANNKLNAYQVSGNSLTHSLTITTPSDISFGQIQEKSVENLPPLASFSSSEILAIEGSTISFDATTSKDIDGNIQSYSWAISDNNTLGSGAFFSHRFLRPGVYNVILEVTDNQGLSNTQQKQIEIVATTELPIADFSFLRVNDFSGLQADFNALSSFKRAGKITDYRWDFGDGSTGSGALISHTYEALGDYIVSLTVTDEYGEEATTIKNLSLGDITPLRVFVTSPKDGSRFSQDEIVITGTTDEPAREVFIGNEKAFLSSDKMSFTKNHTLTQQGLNILRIEATDSNNNLQVRNLALYFDNLAPIVNVTNIQSGDTIYQQTASTNIEITSNEALQSLTVNAQSLTALDELNYSGSLILLEGPQTLNIEAIDELGNTANTTHSFNLVIDSEQPVITTNLTDGFTNNSAQNLQITINDESPINNKIFLNDSLITSSNENNINLNIILQEGANEIKIKSLDLAGNNSEAIIDLTLDSISPVITTYLNQEIYTNQSSFDLELFINEQNLSALELNLNGNTQTLTTHLNQIVSLSLSEGENIISLTATDSANNTTTLALETIHYDITPPVLSNMTPANNEVLIENAINFIAGATSNEPLKNLTVNGQELGININQTLFRGTVLLLSQGSQNIIFEATDLAGNTSTETIAIDFSLDQGPPIIQTDLQDNLLTNQPQLDFNINIADSSEVNLLVRHNDQTVLESTNKTVALSLNLQEGSNNIEIIATDSGDNRSQLLFNQITLDTIAPVISQITPAPGDMSLDTVFMVSGQASEALLEVKLNNIPVNLSSDQLSFSDDIDLGLTGPFVASLEATDLAGNTYNIDIPVSVTINQTAAAEIGPIESSLSHSCTVLEEKVYCWGRNNQGQLGRGTITAEEFTAAEVQGITEPIVKVESGFFHSCALSTTGSLFCWGFNGEGELGLSFSSSAIPQASKATVISGPIDDFALGTFNTCTLQNGGVKCWGFGAEGLLGDGTTTSVSVLPVQPVGLETNVSRLKGHSRTICAEQNNSLKCWGGWQGNSVNQPTANPNLPIGQIQDFVLGELNIGAIIDGQVYIYGTNDRGQYGVTSEAFAFYPDRIFNGPMFTPTGLESNVTEIFSGAANFCAKKSASDEIYCWGNNGSAQLGLGSTSFAEAEPIIVPALSSNLQSLSLGWEYSCAIIDGINKCWGNNNFSQLGNSNKASLTLIPTEVDGLPIVEPSPLVAAFEIIPARSFANEDILFDATSSSDSSGAIITNYEWLFDGSITETGLTVTKSFSTLGTHTVQLTITNSNNETSTLEKIFLIVPEPIPQAQFNYQLLTQAGQSEVQFDGSLSSISEGAVVTYNWNFGDGNTGFGPQPLHSYESFGVYDVSLTATSDLGIENIITYQVSVFDTTPALLTISNPTEGQSFNGNLLQITGLANEKLSQITVNGIELNLSTEQLSFNKIINLQGTGTQRLKFTATDLAGNITTETRSILVDVNNPIFASIDPLPESTIYSPTGSFFLNITTNKPLSQATVNGSSVGLDAGNTSFTHLVSPAPDGYRSIDISLTDDFNNQTTSSLVYNIIIDDSSPVISTTAQENLFTNNSSFNLSATITDDNLESVRVLQNGLEIFNANQSLVDISAILAQGPNNFTIIALDKAQNQSTQTINNINFDNQDPILNITSHQAGDKIFNFNFEVSGFANKPLKSLEALGVNFELTNNNTEFTGILEMPVQGNSSLIFTATDLYGNTGIFELPVEFEAILNPKLIVVASDENNQLSIRGVAGATAANAELKIKTSLFNSTTITTNADGSFIVPMAFFNSAKLTVTEPTTGATDQTTVFNDISTKFSGLVKDTNGNALPGVKVSLGNLIKYTDVTGAFEFLSPPTGIQNLSIDGAPINTETTQYGINNIRVNIGLGQDIILDQPIYLAPLQIDGNETFVSSAGGVTLISTNAPGVELAINDGVKANFPDGTHQGSINMLVVDGDKTTIPAPSFAKPSQIIYLEPTGLTFDEPVELTIPNDNDLPAGVELAIFSMNAEKGVWEIDGMAKVSPDASFVRTKAGQGISHFSPKFAVPLGPVVREFNKLGQPGIDSFQGSLTNIIELPGFQSLGQEIAPRLVYKSAWAKPSVLVTNFFDLSEQRVTYERTDFYTVDRGIFKNINKVNKYYCDSQEGGTNCYDNYFDAYQAQAEGISATKVESWYQPQSIKSQFFVSNITVDAIEEEPAAALAPVDFGTMTMQGIPDKSLISYAVDLVADPNTLEFLDSGIYPSIAHYDIELKNITVSTTKKKFTLAFAELNDDILATSGVVESEPTVEAQILDEIFPSDLQANIFVKNESNSPMGRGWSLAGLQKITNPNSSRILIDEGDGNLSLYNADFTIDTLFKSENTNINLQRAVSYSSWPNAAVIQEQNGLSEIRTIDLSQENPSTNSLGGSLPAQSGIMKSADLCPTQGHITKVRGLNYRERNHAFTVTRKVSGLMLLPSGEAYATDSNEHSLFYKTETGFQNLISKTQALPHQATFANWVYTDRAAINNFCQTQLNANCESFSQVREESCPARIVVSNFKRRFEYGLHEASFQYRNGANINQGAQPIASTETLNNPMGLTAGINGEIFIADYGNNRVMKFDPTTNNYSLYAGNGSITDSGDGGLATEAGLFHPRGLAVDSTGNLYISTENGRIRKVNPEGYISTFAGRPLGSTDSVFADTSHAEEMSLNSPTGITIDEDRGFMYVADTASHRVMRIDMVNKVATLISGNGEACNPSNIGDGATATKACLSRPTWLGLDDNKNLLITDSGNNRIRRVNFTAPEASILFSYKANNDDLSTLDQLTDNTWRRTYRNGLKVFYNAQGQMISSQDRVGRTTTYTYNLDQQIDFIEDPVGQRIQFNYSGNQLQSITTPGNQSTQFFYSGKDLSEVSFPDNTTREFTYDADGLMLSETNQRQKLTQYTYNVYNRLEKVIRPDLTEITVNDALADTVVNDFTGGNIGQLKSLDSGELADGITDAKQNTTSFNKDLNGYITEITDAQNQVTNIQRNLRGQPVLITRPDSSEVSFVYDDTTYDLLRSTDSATGNTRTLLYDEFGNIIEETTGTGLTVTRNFDATTGLLSSETDASGITTQYTYNSLGQVLTQSRPIGNGSTYTRTTEYNSLGQRTRSFDTSGQETLFTPDARGNVLTLSSKKNNNFISTIYTYDSFNRLLTVTSPKNETTQYDYSETGQLAQITDPRSQTTLFNYNDLDQVTRKENPLGQVWEFAYDDNGNMNYLKEPNGDEKTFVYDSLDRLIQKTLPDDTYIYSYDTRDNLIFASNNNSEINLTVDIAGRVTNQSLTGFGPMAGFPNYSLAYEYNANDSRTRMEDSFGGITTYDYFPDNFLKSVTNHKGEVFNFNYDDRNRVKSYSSPAIATTYDYGTSSFISNITHKKGTTTQAFFSYTRNDLGHVTGISSNIGAESFTYDDNNFLSSATHPSSTHGPATRAPASSLGDFANETFNYDGIGNRTSDQFGSLTYDSSGYALQEDYKYRYVYDLNGNMIRREDKLSGTYTRYDYTSENQLIRVSEFPTLLSTTPIKETNYYFDALNRRMAKVSTDFVDSNNSFTRKYIYDGEEILAEFDGSNNLLARYTHSSLRTDDVLAMDVTNSGVTRNVASVAGSYYYLKDHLGTIKHVTNSLGDIVQTINYSAYGVITSIKDALGNDISSNPLVQIFHSFTGREFDKETGLYFYRARFYDANNGRFLQQDPDPGRLSLPFSLINGKIYTGNNPLNFGDPSGKVKNIFTGLFLGALAIGLGPFAIGFLGSFATVEQTQFGGDTGAFISDNGGRTFLRTALAGLIAGGFFDSNLLGSAVAINKATTGQSILQSIIQNAVLGFNRSFLTANILDAVGAVDVESRLSFALGEGTLGAVFGGATGAFKNITASFISGIDEGLSILGGGPILPE